MKLLPTLFQKNKSVNLTGEEIINKDLLKRFPNLSRNYFPGVSLFFGGVLYPYDDKNSKENISKSHGYFILNGNNSRQIVKLENKTTTLNDN